MYVNPSTNTLSTLEDIFDHAYTLLEGSTLGEVLETSNGHSSVKFIRDKLRRENIFELRHVSE